VTTLQGRPSCDTSPGVEEAARRILDDDVGG
jgi:hypothetical protein